MGTVVRLLDGLKNAITGAGTSRDPRTAASYSAAPLTQAEIEMAYRGSGLIKKIVQIPALDMVREWRDWQAEKERITAIEAEERRHSLRQKIKQAEILRALGGGALVLGLPGNPSEPAPPTVGKLGLAYVHVVSRWHLTFQTLQDDARLPGYGEPVMWQMMSGGQQVSIHPSRIIPFRADTSASCASLTLGTADAFWGESVIAQVLDAVKDSDTARASFAALLNKARLTRIGIPDLSAIMSEPGGEQRIQGRLSVIALAESIHNASIFDSGPDGKGGESITDVTYSFAGAKDLINVYGEFVAAISDIPATRLLGRAPDGMNSSGESQQQDWAKKIRAMQTLDLGPCLDRVDAYLIPSALGSVPPEIWWEFEDLIDDDETAEVTRFKTTVEAMEKVQAMACLPDVAFAKAAQNTLVEGGWMPGLDAALAEIPEDERFGIVADLPEQEGGDPTSTEAGGDDNPPGITDAAPRTLYVRRDLINGAEFLAWAKSQGFETTLEASDLHVTIAYSRQPLDWMKVEGSWDGDDGKLTVPAGGARIVEPLGDKGAVVLLFNSSSLSWRHENIIRAGASHDFDAYQPHVTITYDKPEGLDLSKVEPFRGKLEFGPEIFEELNPDWNPG